LTERRSLAQFGTLDANFREHGGIVTKLYDTDKSSLSQKPNDIKEPKLASQACDGWVFAGTALPSDKRGR
jgi:hypothetical protein